MISTSGFIPAVRLTEDFEEEGVAIRDGRVALLDFQIAGLGLQIALRRECTAPDPDELATLTRYIFLGANEAEEVGAAARILERIKECGSILEFGVMIAAGSALFGEANPNGDDVKFRLPSWVFDGGEQQASGGFAFRDGEDAPRHRNAAGHGPCRQNQRVPGM